MIKNVCRAQIVLPYNDPSTIEPSFVEAYKLRTSGRGIIRTVKYEITKRVIFNK